METTIKATPNYRKRTFTIRKYYDGKFTAKYRTFPMNPDEFNSEEMNTQKDWANFLRDQQGSYITIQKTYL